MSGIHPIRSEHISASERELRVSVLGSLPPVKGVSASTAALVEALSVRNGVKLDVHGFRRIYPGLAYPGGDPIEAGLAATSFSSDVKIRNDLTWYNPLSWLRTGLAMRGDVVHAQWWSYALAPVYATVLGLARLRRKRVVMTVHNVAPHEQGRMKRLLNGAVLRFAHSYIVHSHQNREALHRIVGGDIERITVLPLGVLDTPRTGMTRPSARLRLGIPGDAHLALCFGNIRPYKGVDVLLRAFADVVRDDPQAMLVIAGQPWSSWKPYDALIDELGIRDRVRLFLSYVPTDQIEAYFVAADAVVLPYTHFDAQTAVGTRALPFGRPLIVTNTGGLPELVLDHDAIVPPGDAPALAKAITRVLGDEALRDRMAVESLTIAGTLGWAAIAERTVELYTALAGRSPLAVPEAEAITRVVGAGR